MGCSPRILKSSFRGTCQKDLFTVLFLKCLQVFTQMRIDPHHDKNRIQWTKDIVIWPNISSHVQHKLMPFIPRVPRIQCHKIAVLCWTMLNVAGGQMWRNFNNVRHFSLIIEESKCVKARFANAYLALLLGDHAVILHYYGFMSKLILFFLLLRFNILPI